ncbi:MAG: phosphoribosyl 1,2-cyclic phosphate phosphodiesterase, partial [Granulosicoccus sp.]
RAILTNMHSDLDYQALLERLPKHIVPGFDGFQLELSY